MLGVLGLGSWLDGISLPFPVLVGAGIILAIASNRDKQVRLWGRSPQQPSQPEGSPPVGASSQPQTSVELNHEPQLPKFLTSQHSGDRPSISFEISRSTPQPETQDDRSRS